MSKLIASFTILFLICVLLSSVAEGGGGIATSQLNGGLTSAATTITVDSTAGFLEADYVIIEGEYCRYNGTSATAFQNVSRGWNGTTAKAHNDNVKVYSPSTDVLNSALGFNVASTGTSVGSTDIPMIAIRFVTVSLPRLITFDFSFLKEGALQYLRYLFIAIAAGFIIAMVIAIVQALGGILQSIFVRP